MLSILTFHPWSAPDPDIVCDFCHREPAIGDLCIGAVAVWVIGATCSRRRQAPLSPEIRHRSRSS